MSDGLPRGWESTTVGDIANVKRGASPRPIQDPLWWGGNVGWVRISDVTSSRKYLTKTTQYLSDAGVSKSVKIEKGEVVLSICATIGRPIIVKVDACIHDGFVWFDKLRSNIDREFWYYFLLSKEEFLSSQRQSGTQGNLNTGIVSDLICFIPPLPEQQKIATILTAVDDVIESTQAQINKLKDLKTGLMQELLTKGIGHTEFKDSPIGRIPKLWEAVKLETVCNQITDGEHQTPRRAVSGYYLLSARNIRDGFIALSDVDYIPVDEYVRISKRVLPEAGDILISCSGSIGRTAIVPVGLKFSMVRSVAIVKPIHDLVDSQFLAYQISSTLVQSQIEKTLSQLAQANLFQAPIKALNIVLPPLPEQKLIAKTIKSVDEKINTGDANLFRFKNIKKALMQDLLTGKVRVQVN